VKSEKIVAESVGDKIQKSDLIADLDRSARVFDLAKRQIHFFQ
jgi:hypothetical protein